MQDNIDAATDYTQSRPPSHPVVVKDMDTVINRLNRHTDVIRKNYDSKAYIIALLMISVAIVGMAILGLSTWFYLGVIVVSTFGFGISLAVIGVSLSHNDHSKTMSTSKMAGLVIPIFSILFPAFYSYATLKASGSVAAAIGFVTSSILIFTVSTNKAPRHVLAGFSSAATLSALFFVYLFGERYDNTAGIGAEDIIVLFIACMMMGTCSIIIMAMITHSLRSMWKLSSIATKLAVSARSCAIKYETKNREYDYFARVTGVMKTLSKPVSHGSRLGIEFGGDCIPVFEIAGDFYDFVHREATGEIVFWIGDVSGKGMQAGIVMSAIQTTMHAVVGKLPKYCVIDLESVYGYINKTLINCIGKKIGQGTASATMLIGAYKDGKIRIVGQHENVILLKPGQEPKVFDTSDLGYILGIVDDIGPMSKILEFDFDVGDQLVTYSDGATNIMGDDNIMTGFDGLLDLVKRHGHLDPATMVSSLFVHLTKSKPEILNDDITVFAMRRSDER